MSGRINLGWIDLQKKIKNEDLLTECSIKVFNKT